NILCRMTAIDSDVYSSLMIRLFTTCARCTPMTTTTKKQPLQEMIAAMMTTTLTTTARSSIDLMMFSSNWLANAQFNQFK
ncbi:MAG: hypothetical protein CUN55_18755, partial [Phototrophicales bacterium]